MTQYLNKSQVKALFRSIRTRFVWQKKGDFLVRPAMPGESVITLVGGKVETLVGASRGDWIVQNITVGTSAERYIPPGDSVPKRYDISDDIIILEGTTWYRATAKGQITGGFYQGEDVTFEAPWGEDMMLEAGDFLGTPYPCVEEPEDIYRVAKNEFLQTYGAEPAFELERDAKADGVPQASG